MNVSLPVLTFRLLSGFQLAFIGAGVDIFRSRAVKFRVRRR